MPGIITTNSYGVETTTHRKALPNFDPNFLVPTAGAPVSVGDIADEPYLYHLWTYASARVIADNVKWLPKLIENTNNGEIWSPDNDINKLFKSPNPFMPSAIAFWEAVALGLLLPSKRADGEGEDTGGQVFLIGVKKDGNFANFAKGEIPEQIYPYYDSVIKPKTEKGEKGYSLTGWEFVVPGKGKKGIPLELNEVIRIHLFNPYNWLSGLSPFFPSQMALVDDIKSDIYNTQSFENDGTVAGVLKTEQDLSPDQYEQNYKRWMNRHGGSGRNNTIALLGSGLEYQQYGLSQADMQFTEQKKHNFEKFAAAYKLNKIAYGQYEGINFATIKEGRKLLWQDTYQPIDKLITTAITNQWISNVKPGNIILRSDYSGVEALRPDYEKPVKSAQVMFNMGVPVTLAFQLNSIPLTEENLRDYPWLNEKPPEKSAGAGVPGAELPKSIQKTLQKDQLNEEEKAAISLDYIQKVLDPGEKRWRDSMDKFFIGQRNQMQDLVDVWLKKQKAIPEDIDQKVYIKAYWKQLIIDPSQFLLDLIEENKKLGKVFTPLVIAQLRAETIRLEAELGALISWNINDDIISNYIKARQADIKQINTTTFKKANKKIGLAIEEAIKANATPQEAAKLIKVAIADVGEIRKNQSMMIARTETGTISSAVRFDAFRAEGIEYTEWLTANDEKVRETHVAAGNSGPVLIGNDFPAVNMRYPLDPKGLPGEIINCRCVSVPAKAPRE